VDIAPKVSPADYDDRAESDGVTFITISVAASRVKGVNTLMRYYYNY